MKIETNAVLIVFWRWEEMVLRWQRIRGFFYENALYKFTFDIDIDIDR